VSRLPIYLRCLGDIPASRATCSSEQLAFIAGVNSAQVRKDLSYVNAQGVRGVGYNIGDLRTRLRQALGLNQGYKVAIVGAGNLGRALSNYGGFTGWGFDVVAIFDTDRSKIGMALNDLVVESLEDLERVVNERDVRIGIIATPADAAQEVADRFTEAGIRSILNFAPAVLRRPDGVEVRRVDLSTELQILTFHLQQTARVERDAG